MGIIWVGMDAHKKAINVAALFPDERDAHEWALENTAAAVRQGDVPSAVDLEGSGGAIGDMSYAAFWVSLSSLASAAMRMGRSR